MADLSRIVNRLIPAGVSETPDFVVPPEYNALAIRMSRENWPPEGGTVALGYSTDGGNTWTWNEYFIGPAVPTAKDPTIADVYFGYGWNPIFTEKRANRVKARTDFQTSFRSTVTIEAFVASA